MCDGEVVSLWTVAYAGNRAASVIFDRPLGYHGRMLDATSAAAGVQCRCDG